MSPTCWEPCFWKEFVPSSIKSHGRKFTCGHDSNTIPPTVDRAYRALSRDIQFVEIRYTAVKTYKAVPCFPSVLFCFMNREAQCSTMRWSLVACIPIKLQSLLARERGEDPLKTSLMLEV